MSTRNNFTPVRPLSREQFHSLRERVVRETPRMYKSTGTTEPRSVGKTPIPLKAPATAPPVTITTSAITPTAKATPLLQDPLVNMSEHELMYESPVLETLASQSVNKGLEIQRVVVNLIAYAVWNLVLNFGSFYLTHTASGRALRDEWLTVDRLVVLLHIPRYPALLSLLHNYISMEYVRHMFTLLVIYNVMSSILRLVKRVNSRELKLSERQKMLLGFSEQNGTNTKKPHSVLKQNIQKDKIPAPTASTEAPAAVSPPPPYLFKTMESPMKKKMEQSGRPSSLFTSNNTNRSNAFSSSMVPSNNTKSVSFEPTIEYTRRTSVISTSTSMNGAGYIPSNKYAYMMNTPSPRKPF
ncbi:hypothetical protein RNJ44_00930 [Nakaseomyces bracarensis]|uniref:Uncharacterized protein n=1 Tax=Nakaseomyces bracarensis TaxID=273131 RepID=A0ABR4NQN6_9SACH